MASPHMRLGDSSLPPLPLAVNAEVVQQFLTQRRIDNLLATFPNPENIPVDVIHQLPLKTLCEDQRLHSYLASWGCRRLLDPRLIIDTLVACHDTRSAKALVRKFGLQIRDFPDLLQASYATAFSHWVFSQRMTYIQVARLCAMDTEAVIAFARWTNRKEPLAARCAIAMGVEDPEEQARLYREFGLQPISPSLASEEWNEGATFFPISENDIPANDPCRDLLCGETIVSLRTVGLELKDIELVQSLDQFNRILPSLQDATVLAMDCEWRPGLTGDRVYPAALFQLALRDAETKVMSCYLVDIYTLGKNNMHESVLRELDGVLQSPRSLKLGCAFLAQDLGMLRRATSDKKLFAGVTGYCDITALVRSHWDPKFQGGVAKVVSLVLGKDMNKTIQCGNWELRPLTLGQALYAALDVAVLIHIYDLALTRGKAELRPLKAESAPHTPQSVSKSPRQAKKMTAKSSPVSRVDGEAGPGEAVSGADLRLWQGVRNRLQFMTLHSLSDMTLAVYHGPAPLIRTLRSFGFPVLTGFDKEKWVDIANRCLIGRAVLLFFSKQDLDQLEAAMKTPSSSIPPFPYFMLTSSDAKWKIRELLWLWSVVPLKFQVPCLECGHFLRPACTPGFHYCASPKCQCLVWDAHLKWFESRNALEYLEFGTNPDRLALPPSRT